MRINVQRNGILLIFFLIAIILIWSGFWGTTGLVMAAVFTPEYLTETD
jgi:hypothetical protein